MTRGFPYRQLYGPPTFADPDTRVFRPVVPITIYGTTLEYETTGMIDTGCAETILPLRLITEGLVDPDTSDHETGEIYGIGGEPVVLQYGMVDLAVQLKRKLHR